MSLYLSLFKALNEADMQYIVVGGLATVLHGYARLTADIDFVINLEQQEAEKAIQAISAIGLKPRLPIEPMLFTDKQYARAGSMIRTCWCFHSLTRITR